MSAATTTTTITPTLPFSLTLTSVARGPRQTGTMRTDKKQKQNNLGFGGGKKKETTVTGTMKSEKKQRQNNLGFGGGEKKETSWHCVEGCGACCKFDKGPSFLSPEEIFTDPSDVELYKSLIGPDGWCIHYEKSTRKCSIYPERPYFCRVEPEVFKSLYGINKKKFNKEACSCCRDTIKAIYGSSSKELCNFNNSIRSSAS